MSGVRVLWLSFFFFFFQAEDGIRDYKVTGVQTCALPIYCSARRGAEADRFVAFCRERADRGPAHLLPSLRSIREAAAWHSECDHRLSSFDVPFLGVPDVGWFSNVLRRDSQAEVSGGGAG